MKRGMCQTHALAVKLLHSTGRQTQDDELDATCITRQLSNVQAYASVTLCVRVTCVRVACVRVTCVRVCKQGRPERSDTRAMACM